MDYIIRAINKEKDVKIQVSITTGIVENARKIHGLSKTSSAALGRVLTAGVMMTDDLKNKEDSLTINIRGDGSIGRIIVTGKNDGKIKGYVDHPEADVDIRESDNKLDVSKIIGNGTLTIVKDLGLKEPYTGQVPLVSGEVAEDLANYFYTSDQIPSVVGLGVLVDRDYSVKRAGGFILQLMPGASEETISRIEENIKDIKSVTEMMEENYDAKDIMNRVMDGFEMTILEKKEIEYKCDCSREKIKDAILSLGTDEINSILTEDKETEVKCYFCNESYKFNEEDLEELLEISKN